MTVRRNEAVGMAPDHPEIAHTTSWCFTGGRQVYEPQLPGAGEMFRMDLPADALSTFSVAMELGQAYCGVAMAWIGKRITVPLEIQGFESNNPLEAVIALFQSWERVCDTIGITKDRRAIFAPDPRRIRRMTLASLMHLIRHDQLGLAPSQAWKLWTERTTSDELPKGKQIPLFLPYGDTLPVAQQAAANLLYAGFYQIPANRDLSTNKLWVPKEQRR